jgi:hypothetical protein
MPGPVPGIHVLLSCFTESPEDVDGRDRPGHDGCGISINTSFTIVAGSPLFARVNGGPTKKSSEIINLKN